MHKFIVIHPGASQAHVKGEIVALEQANLIRSHEGLCLPYSPEIDSLNPVAGYYSRQYPAGQVEISHVVSQIAGGLIYVTSHTREIAWGVRLVSTGYVKGGVYVCGAHFPGSWRQPTNGTDMKEFAGKGAFNLTGTITVPPAGNDAFMGLQLRGVVHERPKNAAIHLVEFAITAI